jgi:uncharacterized protein
MNSLLSLYRLQQIDSQIDRARVRVQAIQKILDEDDELRLIGEKARIAEDSHRSAEAALKEAELNVKNQRIKIDQTESTLYGGTTHSPKELQDLQSDVASLKRHLITLEDSQLDVMVTLEQTEVDLQSAQTAWNVKQEQRSEQNKSLLQEQNILQSDLERLSKERAATSSGIPANDLNSYDKLRQEKRGIAVAVVNDNSCSACGSSLSAAQVQTAHSPNQMFLCPSCGRILYYGS